MKEYLIETFQFNDHANRQVLEKIKQLPDKQESIKLFSHLINSQKKWMARLLQDPNVQKMDWWDPVYPLEKLEKEWDTVLRTWLAYLEEKQESELFEYAEFVGYDGGRWAARPKDMALQLNYHSVHHRAQIQALIRNQGIQPDFVDYIGTVAKKLS